MDKEKRQQTMKDYFYKDETELLRRIQEARENFGIKINPHFDERDKMVGDVIPYNLERLYVDLLIKEQRYQEAENQLKQMRHSYYHSPTEINLIEGYEYRLETIKHLNIVVKKEIEIAKKEFNQHTVTLVTVIVGIITIFGTANSSLHTKTLEEGLINFFAVILPLLIVVHIVLSVVNKSDKK